MTNRAPTAVLFDADGVLQYPPTEWHELVAGARDGFFPRLLEIESDFLVGTRGADEWPRALDAFLASEGTGMTSEAFLHGWLAFRPDPAALQVVRDVRAAGIRTCLATNQQEYRARMMHEGRFYDDVMDDQFFSYLVGARKPQPEYFHAILEATGLVAGEVLFIDDVAANVEAARAVGLRGRHKPEHQGPDVLRATLVEEGALSA